jgi:tRNA-dihydrouridine synthase
MSEHLERNIRFYGESLGVNLFRKHAVQYLAPLRTTRRYRRELLTRENKEDFLALLAQAEKHLVENG